MSANLAENALRAVYVLVLARFITAQEYGLWTYGGATYALAVGLVILGFDFQIANRIGADRSHTERFIGMTLVLRIGLLVVAGAGLALYAFAIEPPGPSRTILLIFVGAVLGRGVGVWARICFLAFERQGAYLVVSVALRLLEVGLGVTWLSNGGGLLGIVVLHASIWLIEGTAGLLMVRWLLTGIVARFPLDEALRFLSKGAVLGLSGALGIWLLTGPLVMLRHVSADISLTGQVGLALSISMIAVGAVQAFLSSAIPVLSRSIVRDDPRLAAYGRLIAVAALGGGALAGAVGSVVGPPAATLAFGPDFATAGALLGPCLFIGGLVLAPTGYTQLLIARGRRWPGVCANAAAGALVLMGMAPAVQAWGGFGATLVIGLAWAGRAVILIAIAVYRDNHRG